MRKAEQGDLDDIMRIVADTIVLMHTEGNVQWSEDYPLASDFLKDIAAGTLHVEHRNGEVAGFICVDDNEPSEYAGLAWQASPGDAMVIHRMSIAVPYRKQGLGTAFLKQAEAIALQQGKGFLKTDTYSQNPRMNDLFRAAGYEMKGEISFKGKPLSFYCYEKELGDTSVQV